MEELRDKVLSAERNDGFNNYRRIYNEITSFPVNSITSIDVVPVPEATIDDIDMDFVKEYADKINGFEDQVDMME